MDIPRTNDGDIDWVRHNAEVGLKDTDVAVQDAIVRNRLRRILGKDHLDVFQVDLIRILTGPDMDSYVLELIYARNPFAVKELASRFKN